VGEADSRVAGGAFHDGAAWAEEASFFSIEDTVESGAVFDGTAGVLEFGFS